MTPRELRTRRREEERNAAKLAYKAAKASAIAPKPFEETPEEDEFSPELIAEATAARERIRARTNRANAQYSTGPRSDLGKFASSGNSLKHGLASGRVLIPGEDSADFDALLHALLEEHQPTGPTQQLLIQEMAQSYWLMQRAVRFQNECFTAEGIDEKRLSLFLRYYSTHERGFHKALNTLMKLKKHCAPGFVSHQRIQPAETTGFVSQNPPHTAPPPEFVRQNPLAEAA